MKINIKKILTLLSGMLFLTIHTGAVYGQNTDAVGISGTVVDKNNIPIQDVTVHIQEKSTRTESNELGYFSLKGVNGDVLVLDKKGYQPLVVKIEETGNPLTFVMAEHALYDDLTVNMPHITQTQRSLVSAVSTVSDKELEKNGVARIDDALNGIIPGLYTLQSSGYRFGLNNYNLFIRGKATNADSTPLILVDGIESDISLIDYRDVESVTVLKDAASLAVYGMRGANGVILISSKRGTIKGASLEFEVQAGIQNPIHISDRLNAYQYTTLYNEALKNDGQSPIYNPGIYNGSQNPYQYPDVNFKDMYLTNISPYQHYQVSSKGGNNIAQYYISLGYLQQEGLFKNGYNNSYNRFNIRAGVDVNLRKGLKFGFRSFASIDNNKVPYTNEWSIGAINNIFSKIITLPAIAYPVFNADGSLGGTSTYQDNVYGMLNRSGYRNDNARVLNAVMTASQQLDVILPGLAIDAYFGLENYNKQYSAVYHEYAVYDLQPDGTYIQYGKDEYRDARKNGLIDKSFYRYMTFGAGLSYNKRFADIHSVNARILYSQESRTLSGDFPDAKYAGLSFRGIYGLQNKYFAELTASYQGSNSYKAGNRFGFFPAAGLAWIISEEDFMKDKTPFTFAKIRATYGVNGNDNRNNKDRYYDARFPYRQTWSATGGYGFGSPNANSVGAYEGILSNPDIRWEKSYKLNVGIDINLLNDITFTADYFNENRKDVLVNYDNIIPDMIGVKLPQYNGGHIQNQGVELTLAYSKQIGKWNIFAGANMLWAKNKVLDLKEIAYPYEHMYKKGHSVGAIWGYQTNGLYTTDEQLQSASLSQFGTPHLGDIIYVNQNPDDDNVINSQDQVVIGNNLPEIIYGATLGFGYNGIDFNMVMEGSGNYDVLFRPDQFTPYAYDNRWNSQNPGQITSYPRASIQSQYNNQASDYWLDNGRYFSISSIEIGYTFPKAMVRKIMLSDLRIYINGNNIYKFNKMKDNRDNEAIEAGYSQFPLLRTLSLGLSVKL